MPCTTILAGRKATWNRSTMIARNDDSGSGHYTPKKFTVVGPEDQPRVYRSSISHVEIPLPEHPMRYTAMPNALTGEGIWAACGVNEAEVAMTATETITSNPRVLGADPLVEYRKVPDNPRLTFGRDALAEWNPERTQETAGGIGEEDLVVLTLPYVKTAREGALRLGELLKQYGTYEENGIAISDAREVWYLETIGGHHWIAKRVPDASVVVMPNQLGIDSFDLTDAFGEKKDHLCSEDLREFIRDGHLDLTPASTGAAAQDRINPRILFGSRDDADHVYNTPRAWYALRRLAPSLGTYDGPRADFRPEDDDLPWAVRPDRLLTPEDVKYILSSHYQGTKYDPYLSYGDKTSAGAYRSIGVNRTDFLGFVEIRPDMPRGARAIEWVAFGSNVFNTMAPFYVNVNRTPQYLSNTTETVSTENFYWASRLIGALSDASFGKCQNVIERYTDRVLAFSHELLRKWDAKIRNESEDVRIQLAEEANDEIAAMLKKETDLALERVLFFRSNDMRNSYARSDH